MTRATYMIYETAIRFIEKQADEVGQWLHNQPKGAMGITCDKVKATAEWKAKNAEYDNLAAQIRSIRAQRNKAMGSRLVNKIAREIQMEKRKGV